MKFDRPTLVTLTAPTCSGKSFLLNHLVDVAQLFNRIVSTTTRPMRPGEREGVDYYYIDRSRSEELEVCGAFFELIEFNKTRYGVTNGEMVGKMRDEKAPLIVLEPQGLAIYEQKCREEGWDIFKVYVNTTEALRLERLKRRLLDVAWGAIDSVNGSHVRDVNVDAAKQAVARGIAEYESRFLSITGEERRWQNVSSWDAIIPGDDLEEAIVLLERGVRWRNRQRQTPQAVGAVELPLESA